MNWEVSCDCVYGFDYGGLQVRLIVVVLWVGCEIKYDLIELGN